MKGLIIMTYDIEELVTSLYENKVPEMWSKVGFSSRKPLVAWM